MNALTPLALTSEPLLRAIQAGGFATLSELAERAGRHRNHITRDLGTLEEKGLISRSVPSKPALTAAALEQLAAIERANAPIVLHDQIERDPFNPREDFDEEFIKGLAESIYDGGKLTLLQPIVIRPVEDSDKPYRLVAGEQRWRAIGLLIADGRWPADLPVPHTVRILSDEEAEVFALIENVQRQNLNAIDEAKRYRHFRDVRGWTTARIAEAANRSQNHVRNLLKCLELPEDVQARMRLPKDDERFVGARQARHMFQQHREPEVPRLELEPILGLALAELAHKVEAEPATEIGEPGFTRISGWPTVGPMAMLNARKVVTFKTAGPKTYAKVLAHSSGALAWLEGQNFYADPQAVVDHWVQAAIPPAQREAHDRLCDQHPESARYYTRILIVPTFLDEVDDAGNSPAIEANPVRHAVDEAAETLTAIEVLVMAEIGALIEPNLAKPCHAHPAVNVRPAIEHFPVVAGLLGRGLLKLISPSEWSRDFFRISLGVEGWKALKSTLPLYVSTATANDRQSALNDAWDAARAAKAKPDTLIEELRAFFAAPMEIPEVARGWVAERENQARARREREEEQAATRAAEQKARQEEFERGREFLVAIRMFEAIAPDLAADQFAEAFRALLSEHGLEGPFTVCTYRDLPALADGAGNALTATAPELFECLRRVQAIALNHALGRRDVYSGDELPDPNAPIADEGDTTDWEPETEEEFWRIAAETFVSRYGLTEARAAELLQLAMQRLEEQGTVYGDDSSEWGRLDAEFVATGYVEDFPDCIAAQAAEVGQ